MMNVHYTGGGTSARAQASVLDLYDTNRLTHPKRKVGDKFEEVPTFEQLDKMIGDAIAGAGESCFTYKHYYFSVLQKKLLQNIQG